MPRPVSYDYNKRTGNLSGAQRKREGESNLANQEQNGICREIGARTGGDIYIGVVGPVRSGKSTFIKRFMEQLVLPAIGPAAAQTGGGLGPVRPRCPIGLAGRGGTRTVAHAYVRARASRRHQGATREARQND